MGLSAGGVSAAYQTVANTGDSEGLFHGIWAESGAIEPVGWMNESTPQSTYATFAKAVCGANVSVSNALPCLKGASVEAIRQAAAGVGWAPLVDGDFFVDNPQWLHSNGTVAKIPVIAGRFCYVLCS